MFKKLIKKILFGDIAPYTDVERVATVVLYPTNRWYVPKMDIMNTQMVYDKEGGEPVSLTYVGGTNRLELSIDGKATPANITSRVQKTINNRLKKANIGEIPTQLFDKWEQDLMESQGPGEGTYASLRVKKKA